MTFLCMLLISTVGQVDKVIPPDSAMQVRWEDDRLVRSTREPWNGILFTQLLDPEPDVTPELVARLLPRFGSLRSAPLPNTRNSGVHTNITIQDAYTSIVRRYRSEAEVEVAIVFGEETITAVHPAAFLSLEIWIRPTNEAAIKSTQARFASAASNVYKETDEPGLPGGRTWVRRETDRDGIAFVRGRVSVFLNSYGNLRPTFAELTAFALALDFKIRQEALLVGG